MVACKIFKKSRYIQRDFFISKRNRLADKLISDCCIQRHLLCSLITMKDDIQIEITIENNKEENNDVIIAMLTDVGFDGFDESNDSLKAYVSKSKYDEAEVNTISNLYHFSYIVSELQSQNWNAVWESNFEPVVVDDFVVVRAHFHAPIKDVQHEIVITPKMSFGTGHHATTTMMIQQMHDIDFSNKTIFDFGTGTGILAILAEKLGAAEVIAVDNDEWSIDNSKENIERNECQNIRIELADSVTVNDTFDIILANINRNVILENMAALNDRLYEKGYLLVSGLLKEDEEIILREASRYPLLHQNTRQLGQWISLLFSR